MNDMRSTAQAIDVGDEPANGISSTPPRSRPERVANRGAKKMSRRQSIAERARQEAVAKSEAASAADFSDEVDEPIEKAVSAEVESGDRSAADQTLFDDESLNAKLADRASQRASRRRRKEGLDSRPARRRDADEDVAEAEEDRFPWHFQFDEDDEPEELQASTPLLSRAFRASTG